VIFAEEMRKTRRLSLDGQRVVVSGSGNVAINAIAHAQTLGATVEVERGRLKEYAARRPAITCVDGGSVWDLDAAVALPCARQNEPDGDAAARLVRNGLLAVGEGANMPSTRNAVAAFQEAVILFGPGKAANAGGVATSALECSRTPAAIPGASSTPKSGSPRSWSESMTAARPPRTSTGTGELRAGREHRRLREGGLRRCSPKATPINVMSRPMPRRPWFAGVRPAGYAKVRRPRCPCLSVSGVQRSEWGP
jgi:hypothetical protein